MAKRETILYPDEKFLISLSNTIKELRLKNKLTQEKLADLSEIHWRTVQRVEKETRNISLGLFLRLAKGLNISPAELMQLILNDIK
jgi:transcriptional regulator with XRE-family HTH domain